MHSLVDVVNSQCSHVFSRSATFISPRMGLFNGEAGGRSISIVTRLRIGQARFDSPQTEKLLIATVSTFVLGPYLLPRDHHGSDVNLTTYLRLVPTLENVMGYTSTSPYVFCYFPYLLHNFV
jgi:hypothetical protein